MDIEDILKEILLKQISGKAGKEEDFGSEKEARDELESFLKPVTPGSELKVGDYVVRNEFGKKRYNYPKKGTVAKVIQIYPEKFKQGVAMDALGEDLVLCMAVKKGRFIYYNVDSTYYKKATDVAQNIYHFKKKKNDD